MKHILRSKDRRSQKKKLAQQAGAGDQKWATFSAGDTVLSSSPLQRAWVVYSMLFYRPDLQSMKKGKLLYGELQGSERTDLLEFGRLERCALIICKGYEALAVAAIIITFLSLVYADITKFTRVDVVRESLRFQGWGVLRALKTSLSARKNGGSFTLLLELQLKSRHMMAGLILQYRKVLDQLAEVNSVKQLQEACDQAKEDLVTLLVV